MVDEKVKAWYRTEETYARAAAASWIGHPEVRGVLDRFMPAAEAATRPLLPYMVDQKQIMRFCWRVCGIGARYPDGSEEPNPFDPDGSEPWPLSAEEREIAGYVAALFHRVVMAVASELDEAEVQFDPGWAGDQAIIGVLLLLPLVGYETPWQNPVEQLTEQIQPPGASAISPDGRDVSARDGRPEELAKNADRIRRRLRAENGGRDLRLPYAGGKQRALPKLTQIRRDVLKEIHSQFPDATVQRILRTYDHSTRVGGRFRRTLEQQCKKWGITVPDKPSESTLYSDFASLGISVRPSS